MTIEELIELCRRRIQYLNGVRASASALGDAEQVASCDDRIATTQTTLNQLLTLA
jgi:hypothetical protein